MRNHLGLLAIASALVLSPAACGSSSSNPSGQGDDGGSGSGGSSGSGSGSSSGTGSSTGSSSGAGSGSSSGTGSSSGHAGSSSGSSSGTGSSSGSSGSSSGGMGGNHIKTIFLILMENNNWSTIKGSSSAPYINNTLLPASSYCSNYFDNPNAVHPSEPNYIWLEAGTNALSDHTFSTDNDPSASNSSAADHLTKELDAKGVAWRTYAEDTTAGSCPIASSGLYAPKHVPQVFFQDVVGSTPSSSAAKCVSNVVPFTQLAGDLTAGTVGKYNFITPNLCDDMHGAIGCPADLIKAGDDWLAANVPTIMASNAYKQGGAIFITWDESEGGELPIGMIVLSPLAKGNGYTSPLKYYHSSMVRTVQEVLLPGVALLNDAANQPPLSDLFQAGMYP